MTTARAGAARPRVPESALQLILLAGPMLSMIDSSVVNVAVPVIVTELHTTLATAAWALSGYLLGPPPPSGWPWAACSSGRWAGGRCS